MNPTKQSSKSSRLKRLEHILKTSDDDFSRCQTPSRWLVQKHSTRCQRHPTRGPLKNTWSVNLLKLSKDVSTMKFFFGKIADLYLQFFKNAMAHFFQRICCILRYTYFSKQIWLTASGRFLKDVSFAFTLKYLKLKNACTLELVFTKL